MCRWLGYVGAPIEPRELLYDPERSLIEQSRQHAPGMPVPNGDGFGLGWYGRREVPALFHSDAPAWGDRNLATLSAEVCTPMFLAHVRAATGTPVQETNCHPFAAGRWMFVHNGYVADHARLRRDLVLAVRPDLFGSILGTTDSEVLFLLAITFGLLEDPLPALERMAGFVESVAAASGVADPLQMTLGLTDGARLHAVRYASGGEPNTLWSSADVETLRLLYPERERFAHFSPGARVVVSEPLVALPGAWQEVPAGSALVVAEDGVEQLPFVPRPPG
ncbi:Glutamine amidotransferases class-II [Modestobacter italicus]|uniref:Glutamine amidotransferases class-II n=1 Tax=Modestobacter italicus (strain DSM 44449 / CECT 9708 / BC 501) TaxID=2732864 RepID=I4EWS5_MODI5|nr:class II glutamine amidotransferase [Modestobacter marinus]CCH87838.1 Glutamine amidotransferases class-II [Modestobacter marinus]